MYVTQTQYVRIILLYVASRRVRSTSYRYHRKPNHTAAKQYMWRRAFHLGIWSTHDQPASCRARPSIEDGLEDTMWIRPLGGERLLASMLWSTKCSEPLGATSIKMLCRAPIWPAIVDVKLWCQYQTHYIGGQSGAWYNSRPQSTRYHYIRRRLW